jgi:molybdopterin-binding protein
MADFSLPKGIIKSVTSGIEETEVVILLPEGKELVTVFSNNNFDTLKPEEGRTAYAFVSEGRVMLLTDSGN